MRCCDCGLEDQVSISLRCDSSPCLDLLLDTAFYPVCTGESFLRANLSRRGTDLLHLAKVREVVPSPSRTSSLPIARLSTGATLCLVTVPLAFSVS